DAECFGRFEIERQYVLGRCLHCQVRRLLALEDAIDVAGRLPELLDEIRPIRHQAAASDEEAFPVDRRQFMPSRQREDELAMSAREGVWGNDQTATRFTPH